MQDIFNSEEGNRDNEIKQLEKQKKEKEEMITSAGMKLVEGDLDKTTFNGIKEKLTDEVNTLNCRIIELKEADSGFDKYLQYGVSLLSKLPQCYQEAGLDVKQKMLGSIFPEKLVFDNGTYRTTMPSEVLSLLLNVNKGFNGVNKKRTAKKTRQSFQVSLEGLEPSTQ